jgi:hypothetical protein
VPEKTATTISITPPGDGGKSAPPVKVVVPDKTATIINNAPPEDGGKNAPPAHERKSNSAGEKSNRAIN